MADYTVQAGDTLSKIAQAHGTTVSELAKQNGIKDVNRIEIGQELSLGNTTNPATTAQKETTIGLDSFEKQTPQEANTFSPLAYSTGTAIAVLAGQKVLPKMIDKTKTAYTNAKSGTTKAYANMKATAKQNAKAVKSFVAQKIKHAAKSAELHYAFGKDAVETKVKNIASKTKTTAGKAMHKAKVGGRYTRFIANTKVAPKLIKGASRYALPLTVAFEGGKCYQAFEKGGVKEGTKQVVKSVTSVSAGLAGAKLGAAVGSFVGPIGTVVGGFVGGVAGYMLGEKICS